MVSLEGYISYFNVIQFLRGITNNVIEGIRTSKENLPVDMMLFAQNIE